MRRQTSSRTDILVEIRTPSPLRAGRKEVLSSVVAQDEESAEKKAAVNFQKSAITLDQVLPSAGRQRSRGFFGDLAAHLCFSVVFVFLIVAGLRWERRKFQMMTTKQHDPAGRLRGKLAILEETDEFSTLDEVEADAIVARLRHEVKAMRDRHVIMSIDPAAQLATASLQNATKRLLRLRYGPGPTYDLALRLSFPQSMGGGSGKIIIRTAPIDLMPHAVHVFLDAVLTKALRPEMPWKSAFHRRASHVLQAFVRAPNLEGLAFQEYHPSYPHKKHTLGFAGRPGGPEFYISTLDNTRNHGPGSQGSRTEADSCFATIIQGLDQLERMKTQPGAQPPSGFVKDSLNFIELLGVDLI